MSKIHSVQQYFRDRQPPPVRLLHFSILSLVISQIIVSNFMGFAKNGEIGPGTAEFFGTWIHIATGITLIPLSFVFVYVELKRYGIRHFVPYIYGDFSQIKSDLQQIVKFRLPEPRAFGIAAAIQGLGFGAIGLVTLSGLAWFLSWLLLAPWANDLKELHELFTGLIEAYVIGHGGMGLLHLFIHLKNQQPG